MSAIRATIIVDLPDGASYDQYIDIIHSQISRLTGLQTRISVKEVDDPLSMSPLNTHKVEAE